MTRILDRYIFKETLQVWAIVIVVLIVIMLTNQLAKVLGDAAANQLPKEDVFLVLGLSAVQYLTILVPVSLFLAILFTLGRLYRDSEMYALMACGTGPAQIYRPLLIIGFPLAALVAWLAVVVTPASLLEVKAITRAAKQRADLRAIEPGHFVMLAQAGVVAYAESVAPSGHLRNVFIERPDGMEVIVAEEAWQQDGAEPNLKILTFAHGRRYEGRPGSGRFRVAQFEEHGIPYIPADQTAVSNDPRSSSAAVLWSSGSPAELAELQWRMSAPAMLLVLLVLAVPLSKAAPRQGRYTGLVEGILIYITYSNLLGIARVWMEHQRVPSWVGLWWVHALGLTLGLAMLGLRFGSRWRHRWAVGGQERSA